MPRRGGGHDEGKIAETVNAVFDRVRERLGEDRARELFAAAASPMRAKEARDAKLEILMMKALSAKPLDAKDAERARKRAPALIAEAAASTENQGYYGASATAINKHIRRLRDKNKK